MEAPRHNRRRGAALMLSLWALFLLSAMVISWALDIDSRLTLSGHANRILEAEALACSGAEVAQVAKPGSPALVGGFGRDQRYEVRITGEGGRLNINWVAGLPDNPARREVLRKYLEIKGVDLNDCDPMIDALFDWVRPNTGLHSLNAPPESEDYHPSHAPLKQIEELKKIKGWEEFTSAKDWDSDLTLDSVTGINIAWASRDVLLALPGMSEDRVNQFLALRPGPDGIDGTEDDAFTSLTDALAVLGVTPQQLGDLVVFNRIDTIQRVMSVGKSGDVTRTVRMVVLGPGIPPQLRSWKEF
jgi:hypothetical protein